MAKSQTKNQSHPAANGSGQSRVESDSFHNYVLSLTVENVRCFGQKQTLNFADKEGKPAQWTVILGENGMGKTALLQALVGFNPFKFRIAGKDRLLPRALEGLSVPYPTSSTETQSFLSQGYIREGHAEASCLLKTLPCSTIHSIQSMEPGNVSWELNINGQGGSQSSPKAYPYFFAYGAGRKQGSTSIGKDVVEDPTITLFDENAQLRNAEEWLLLLDYTSSKESEVQEQQKKRLEDIKQLLIEVLPDIEDIRFDAGSGTYPKPRVEFKTFSGWVPLRRLGYGYQTMIAWVTDFASRMVERYPDSLDPLKEPAIVLVDEIDLHLHPVWQRKLIAFLTQRFPNTQFIATAHSPLVVQAAENANIALLKRVGDHVEIMNNPEEIRGWRIDQILTSDLFGLKSSSPPSVEALYDRKVELSKKTKLSANEKKELSAIQEKIDQLPVGDSAHVAKEMRAIQEALAILKEQQPK